MNKNGLEIHYMQSDYINIFPELFYDVEQDEEMYMLVKESCKYLGSIIVKYGELVNELFYKENNGDGFVDFVIVLFLRKIMEHLDAISILVEKSSFTQAKIILRTLLESVVGLRFILKEDTEKRAAAYYLYHHYEEIEKMRYFDESMSDGKMYKSILGEERFNEIAEKCKKKKSAFERLIQSKSIFVEIENLRIKRIEHKQHQYPNRKPYITWFEICSNTNSIKGMMKALGWEKYYEALYGGMSMEVHAYNATTEMTLNDDGLHLKTLRNPLGGYDTIELAGTFALSGLIDIYDYLNDGEEEKEEFRVFYKEYVKKGNELKVKYEELLSEGKYR